MNDIDIYGNIIYPKITKKNGFMCVNNEPTIWIDIATKFAPPVITAFVTWWLTSKSAFKRFYREKWWEYRLKSFNEIIEISYRIHKTDEYFLEVYSIPMEIQDKRFVRKSPEIESEMYSTYRLDSQEIIRISHLSEFNLTPEASKIIGDYLIDRANIDEAYDGDHLNLFEVHDHQWASSKKLLELLVKEAKRELKTNELKKKP